MPHARPRPHHYRANRWRLRYTAAPPAGELQAAAAAGRTLTLVCAAGGCWGSVSEPGGQVPGWGLAGLVVVLVGLDQGVEDPGQVFDVAGGQGLDEVAADLAGVGWSGPGPLSVAVAFACPTVPSE